MTMSHQYRAEVLRDRFGMKVAAQLSRGAEELPHDIQERLRVARQQAVGRRKVAQPAAAPQWLSAGPAAVLGARDEGLSWGGRLAGVLPLIALVVGLFTINAIQNERAAHELADVDAALLTDDLPPVAYVDPGFAQFLKVNREGVQ